MKLILAEDSGLLRESLAAMLERQGFSVVAQCGSATEIQPLVDRHATEVDLLVTDVRMPPNMSDDGIRAAAAVHANHPSIGIVVCSQYVAPAYARHVMRMADGHCGIGYVLKDSIGHVAEFITTLRAVARGELVIDPTVARSLARTATGIDLLTERENTVLSLMSTGLSNTDIAEELVVSQAAVAKHIASIFQKLGLHPGEDNRRVKAILAYLTESGV